MTLKNVIRICGYNWAKKRFKTKYTTPLIKILFEFSLLFNPQNVVQKRSYFNTR